MEHPLTQLLPTGRTQAQVYPMGARGLPPGLEGYGPMWEPTTFILAQRATQQAIVALKPDFQLLALIGSSAQAAGLRVQLYDTQRKRRFFDRGVNFENALGAAAGANTAPFFLREPYSFEGVDKPQILVVVQNLAVVQNVTQVVLYGVCKRWNE